jgi:gliding motility-associated-like protein
MSRFIIILLLTFGIGTFAKASHVMGGEITWVNENGKFIFTLVFYRDCMGADINTVSETIRVWNHPTITSITLAFVSRTDISPMCKPVSGSQPRLSCGNGTSGGNGIGAIEKVIYKSSPLELVAPPPSSGWVFTYENFSRGSTITNISNPSNYGTTIAAKMYATPDHSKGDSSPLFLQEPYFVSCLGAPFVYNMNPVDPDLDSISVSFGIPYNNFQSVSYNPPNLPVPVPFEPGFSFDSPTPDASVSPGSVAAKINSSSGELSFTSMMAGNFVVKVAVKSYRYNVLIAEVEREMQLVVLPCTESNNIPDIKPPFSGGTSYETTVNAGILVNFDLISTDVELMQDGSPQSNVMSASGPLFGTDFSSTTGCAIAPCATLNPTPIITDFQGASTNFKWQTSCDHLIGTDGYAKDMVPYHFVFRVQDDFCPVPKVAYTTITINVVNPGVIPAPKINCIQSDASGNITLNWDPVDDPSGTFISYKIYSVQNGLLATLPVRSSNSWTDNGVGQQNDYYVSVVSGCNGNASRNSDTLSTLFLDVTNPADGTAVLTWNNPSSFSGSTKGKFYHIYREYPAGIWSLRDSVPFGSTFYRDTIDICEANLNYRVVLPSISCDLISNKDGGQFKDMLTPKIPEISSLSVDTLSGELVLTWNINPAGDTYGYVVYTYNSGGYLTELDTVWGISQTTYRDSVDMSKGPLTYTVAAFDSCFTNIVPPTYQTSAKATPHSSIFLSKELDKCSKTITLKWTPYVGWSDILKYVIYGKTGNGSYKTMGQTNGMSLTLPIEELEDYCFAVKAISNDSLYLAFSNPLYIRMKPSIQPNYHYLQNATVQGAKINLRHLVDASSGVRTIAFERENKVGAFQEISRVNVMSDTVLFTDTLVDVERDSYTYRARIVDSCGNLSTISNPARSILLKIQKDEIQMLNYLTWNPYAVWDGKVIAYRLFRDIGNGYSTSPLAFLPPTQLSFEDNLSTESFNGKVCYYVEAIEGDNRYNNPKQSRSNEACELFEPIVYIPNAFTPGGINPIFYPALSQFDQTDYDFTVFDRWGRKIFQTNNPAVGWDGMLGDTKEMAQTGTYLYIIKMRDGEGIEHIRRGFVSLLK